MILQMDDIGPLVTEAGKSNHRRLIQEQSLGKLLKGWHFAWVELQETGDAEKYQD